MASAYYKVTAYVGTPHRNAVEVTIPLVGPTGPTGPQGPKGDPGEVSGSIAWDNVTDKPSTFTPSSHTHPASDITSGTLAHERGGLKADVSAYDGLLKISGGSTSQVSIGTGANDVASGDHTHTQLHDRSHAITSTSDHTAGNHKVFYSNGSGEVVELALGNSGEVLTSNGATSAPSFAAASGGATSQTDIFTANGTWTKPAGAKLVHYLLIGGGGGGGAGRRSASTNALGGGGGGAGGGITAGYVDPAFLSATETITVGAGGTGGTNSADNTNGAGGAAGGDSSFGSSIKVKGGNAGGGGSFGGGLAGSATTLASLFYASNASTAAGASGSASSSAPSDAASNLYLPTGGGGGGGRGSNTNGSGSKGGDIGQTNTGVTSAPSISAGSNGPVGIRSHSSWSGTGGGGGSMSSDNAVLTGFSGGNGGPYGGGGGGGSGAGNGGGGSTAGGNGGDGIVVITTYF